MASKAWAWYERHRNKVDAGLLAVLLLVLLGQAYLLERQRRLDRVAAQNSNQLLNTYMKGDTAQVASGPNVALRLRNVRFMWSNRVFIDTDDMAVRAEPVEGAAVNFDNPQSFVMAIQQSTVDVSPPVLEGMFNESVFNYPGSTLRDLKVSIARDSGGDEDDHGDRKDQDGADRAENAEASGKHHGFGLHGIHLPFLHHHHQDRDMVLVGNEPGAGPPTGDWIVHVKGSINVLVWIPFAMDTELSVDPAGNALVIGVRKLKLLGFLPATKLIKLEPFHLDKFIPRPPNGSLDIAGNRILVHPLGLFPPPRVKGRIEGVRVNQNGVRIAFAGAPIPAPAAANARNYLYLKGGTAEFGHIRMSDTDVLITDQNPNNRFVFSLTGYQKLLPRCRVEVPNTNSVRVTMPDYG